MKNYKQANSIDINGTSYKKSVELFYLTICKKIGEEHSDESLDGKVTAEWAFELSEDTIVTIYDYKSKVSKCENTVWHIGGKGDHKLINKFIKELIGY